MRLLHALTFVLLPWTCLSVCPTGTIQGDGPRTCYATYRKEFSWTDAEEFCQLNNGHLLTVADAERSAKLGKVLGEGTYWIGAVRDISIVGTRTRRLTGWKWIDGSEWINTNWACRQPTPGLECVVLGVNGTSAKWYAAECSERKNFICTIPPEGKPRPPLLPEQKETPPKCPALNVMLLQSWRYYEGTELCYSFAGRSQTWRYGDEVCRRAGGLLASVTIENIQKILQLDKWNTTAKNLIGIGLKNETNDWKWLDGTPVDDFASLGGTPPTKLVTQDASDRSSDCAAFLYTPERKLKLVAIDCDLDYTTDTAGNYTYIILCEAAPFDY